MDTEWAASRTETTTEDAVLVIHQALQEDDDYPAMLHHIVRRLADADLLATARTRPTRDDLILALAQADGQAWPDGMDDHTAEHMYGKQADAVLALLADQPDPAETTTAECPE